MGTSAWHSIGDMIKNIKGADEIWDYDRLNATFLEWNNIKVNRIVPSLYSKNLERVIPNDNPELDVLFYGTLSDRRVRIIKEITYALYGRIKFAWIFGEPNMEHYISNSKVVLNLHPMEPWNRQEQVRMFFPLINGKTNISETSQQNNMPGEIIECPTEELTSTILRVCGSDEWRTFGLQAREKFKQRTRDYLLKEWGRQVNHF